MTEMHDLTAHARAVVADDQSAPPFTAEQEARLRQIVREEIDSAAPSIIGAAGVHVALSQRRKLR